MQGRGLYIHQERFRDDNGELLVNYRKGPKDVCVYPSKGHCSYFVFL